MPRPRGQLDDRQAATLELGAKCGAWGLRHRHRLDEVVRLEPELADQTIEALPVGRPHVDRELDARGDDVVGARLDFEPPDGGDTAVDRRSRLTNDQHVFGRGHKCVLACSHRDSPRVPGGALENSLRAGDTDDVGDEPERCTLARQHRPLLDMHLEERTWKRARGGKRPAPHAPALLVAEDHDRAVPRPLDRVDRCDDAERPVELAAVRDGVEMRARPDVRGDAAADQIPRGIDLDLEAGLLHPLGGEIVGALLALGAAHTVRAGPAADRVQLVEALEDPRAYSPNGLNGLGDVDTNTLFVSR